MSQPPRWRFALAAVAGGLLLVVVLTGWGLARRYHPGPWGDTGLPAVAWTRRLARWHRTAMALAVPATIAWVLLLWPAREARRRGVAIVAGSVAIALGLVTSLTWDLVRFDQIALRSVTVGVDLSQRGLWWPAFDPDVLFVFVRGREVSRATYARWLLVHLFAPMAAVVALVISWWASTPPPETGPDGKRLGRRQVTAPSPDAGAEA